MIAVPVALIAEGRYIISLFSMVILFFGYRYLFLKAQILYFGGSVSIEFLTDQELLIFHYKDKKLTIDFCKIKYHESIESVFFPETKWHIIHLNSSIGEILRWESPQVVCVSSRLIGFDEFTKLMEAYV